MNSLKIAISIAFLGTVLLNGSDMINEQIEAIQKASPQERVELMNRLKIQLATMNEEERTSAIKTLQGRMGGNANYLKESQPSNNALRMNQIQSMQQNTIQQRAGDTANTQFKGMRR